VIFNNGTVITTAALVNPVRHPSFIHGQRTCAMTWGGASVFPFPTTVAVPHPDWLPPISVIQTIFPNRIRNLPHCSIWYEYIFQLRWQVIFGILCSLTAKEIFHILSEYFGKVHESLRLSRFTERVEACPSIISSVLRHKFEVGRECLLGEVVRLVGHGGGILSW
jgi:hypothetical protein